MFDVKEIAEAVLDVIEEPIAGLSARIGAVEKTQPIRGKDGRNGVDGKDGLPGKDGRDGQDGKDGSPGADGKDAPAVTKEQIIDALLSAPDIIELAVTKYFQVNPAPAGRDGRDGSDGRNGRDGADGKDGLDGKDGRDGLDIKDLFRADGGRLIAVMTDGTVKDMGVYVGRDGADGLDGKDGERGPAGKDGADGIGFEDMDLVENDEGLHLRFSQGTVVKSFPLPVPTDHGVWKERLYRKGQGVTWAGSFWIAQRDTDKKPDTEESGWRLAVKRGRDARREEPVKS